MIVATLLAVALAGAAPADLAPQCCPLAQIHKGLTDKPLHEKFILIGDSFEDIATPLLGVSMVKMLFGGKATLVVTISTDQANFNLYTTAGSPTARVNVICVLNSAKICYATSTANWGWRTGTGWANGTTLKLVSSGYIYGAGGKGGDGGDGSGSAADGRDGLPGGDAIRLDWPLSFDNTSGYVYAGGGGASGGADYWAGGAPGAGGGGGGGGIGYVAGAAGLKSNFAPGSGANDGEAGTNGVTGGGGGDRGIDPFYLVEAGNGGSHRNQTFSNGQHNLLIQDYGDAGNVGQDSATHHNGAGGAAGRAVVKNGFVLTWQGGNNSTQVKGAEV